jgi:hypothetical protein
MFSISRILGPVQFMLELEQSSVHSVGAPKVRPSTTSQRTFQASCWPTPRYPTTTWSARCSWFPAPQCIFLDPSYPLLTHKIRQHPVAGMTNPQRGHGGSYAAASAPAPTTPNQLSNDNNSRSGFTNRGPRNAHRAPTPASATTSQPASNNNVAASSRNMNMRPRNG